MPIYSDAGLQRGIDQEAEQEWRLSPRDVQDGETPQEYLERAKGMLSLFPDIHYVLKSPPPHWSDADTAYFTRMVLAELIEQFSWGAFK